MSLSNHTTIKVQIIVPWLFALCTFLVDPANSYSVCSGIESFQPIKVHKISATTLLCGLITTLVNSHMTEIITNY